ncbi:cyclase family protein [Burkholderia sp. Ac-20353]|uniref:cyclase family protein n=1 Tax=Burkholderia sp. Ac-20353 TaxID=2703894 RepID=UPI00197B7E2D|nr:cyclase family protein [Burkholderia sp. Ac-20353]MBN3787663.1 cyclase family protein [Burkholderia sp. Ac-20353]
MSPSDVKALPRYAELLQRSDAPPGSSWGLFGKNDQIGTLNFLSAETRAAAVKEVHEGRAFSLDLRSDVISPSLAPTRKPMHHHIFQRNDFHRDEWIDGLYTQYGSQIDGFRHIGHPEYGFYNGHRASLFLPGTETLGMQNFAALPIAGRGVLIDIARYMEGQGTPIDQAGGQAIPISVVEAARRAQGVEINHGDIVLLRFGWLDYYRHVASEEVKENLVKEQFHPGLKQSHETVAWLWDNRISLIAADNFALECWPAQPDSPFFTSDESDPCQCGPHAGIMHRSIIPLLGMPIGELWDLDALSAACAEDRRYSFLITIAPLPIVGGVGSPANAIAIR